ncbi:MAG: DUF4296 domain-containing protein [Sphingobacteriaceae bacterium]
MRRLLLLFFVYVFLSACGDDTPDGIIDKETMVPLLTDLHLADGYASSIYGDSVNEKSAVVYKALYKKYGTDSLGLRKSLDYYIKHPEKLEPIYKQVETSLQRYEKEEQERVEKLEADAERKRKKVEAIGKLKAKIAKERSEMSKGKYDFGLKWYKAPLYFKNYKYPAKAKKEIKSKADTLKSKIDTLK